MKSIQVSEDIVALADVKANLSQILKDLDHKKRPLIITQNGRPAGVLLSTHDFDRMQEKINFMAAVEEGLSDAKAGFVLDDDELDKLLEDADQI